MLDELIVLKSEDVDARVVAVAGPVLMAVQDGMVPFGDDTLDIHCLARRALRTA